MGKIVKEFRDFLLQGNLVTLAIAFVMGTAFAKLLETFVGSMITPIIGLIFGKSDFGGLSFTLNGSNFYYGALSNALITFASIAAAVFFFIVKPYERFSKPEEDTGPSDEERRHQEVLAALRSRG